jgi:hypothetical protein
MRTECTDKKYRLIYNASDWARILLSEHKIVSFREECSNPMHFTFFYNYSLIHRLGFEIRYTLCICIALFVQILEYADFLHTEKYGKVPVLIHSFLHIIYTYNEIIST